MQRLHRLLHHLKEPMTHSNLSVQASPCGFLDNVVQAPPDSIFGIKAAYAADTDPRKINLSVGAYRSDDGKPVVLNCVRKAEAILLEDTSLHKEYLPQRGDGKFAEVARDLMFERTAAAKQNRIASCQTLSGTGALRIGAEFIKRFLPNRCVYISDPTWGTHKSILDHAGVSWKSYRYWNDKTKSLDMAGLLGDIGSAPMGSIILLHAVAHNPTGMDPNKEQWKQIAEVCRDNGNICWFDCAYQGFASGDLQVDRFSIEYFAAMNLPMLASQSFAKNFGLYGERVGTFSAVCAKASQVAPVLSHLDLIIRNLYSNPPRHGANIVKTVLTQPKLALEWKAELRGMANRISNMRTALHSELITLRVPGNWDHIINQIGMFSFTGLSSAQCDIMIGKHHVYLLKNGRISMAGVNTKNVSYIASAIKDVVENPLQKYPYQTKKTDDYLSYIKATTFMPL